jgi:hypothetical protein
LAAGPRFAAHPSCASGPRFAASAPYAFIVRTIDPAGTDSGANPAAVTRVTVYLQPLPLLILGEVVLVPTPSAPVVSVVLYG